MNVIGIAAHHVVNTCTSSGWLINITLLPSATILMSTIINMNNSALFGHFCLLYIPTFFEEKEGFEFHVDLIHILVSTLKESIIWIVQPTAYICALDVVSSVVLHAVISAVVILGSLGKSVNIPNRFPRFLLRWPFR